MPVLSDNNCETRYTKSVTGQKSDNSIESYDRSSFDQQEDEALSFFLHGHEATSADKENAAERQLTTSLSTTAIQASPASALVQHSQMADSNNIGNLAHGEQGWLHRFPPQFNFYTCANVQIYNNFPGSD